MGYLSDEEFDEMHIWDINDSDSLQYWIDYLEKYNVFFSTPLDIDFLMLEYFGDVYKSLLNEKEGPRIMVKEKEDRSQMYIKDIEEMEYAYPEYINRIAEDVRHSLKECGGDGSTYSEKQKKLMVWYTYFFLNRGKPSTHIEAFSRISDEMLVSTMPPVFTRMITVAEKILRENAYENCCARKLDTM